MKCFVDNKEIDIGYTSVLPPPYNEAKKCRYCLCKIEDELNIEIEYDKKITSVVVRPLSLNTQYSFCDNKVFIKLNKACNVSVEVNDSTEDTLLLFVNKDREYLSPEYKNIIRFKSGITNIDKLEITTDNTLVLFEDGAVVNGKITVKNVNNLKICGTGILTMSNYTRGLTGDMTRCLDILESKNIIVEDICIFDSCNWSFRLNECDNAEVNNVKIIGYRGNSDGIDVCGSRDVHISNCFIRTSDDSFVLKAFDTGNVKNVLFEKSTLWNDMARPVEVGVELRCEEVTNIVFRDIDVIHLLTCYPVFGIHHGDRAKLSDIHFENIRIENAPGAQLFDFRITDSEWNKDTAKGCIKNIYVRDIFLVGKEGKDFKELKARIDGFSEDADIENVYLENIVAFGKKITSKKALGLEVRGFAENIVFKDEQQPELIESGIEITEKFKLSTDGKYHGKIKLTIENKSHKRATGNAGIHIYPKNKALCDEEDFYYSLKKGEKIQKEYDIITTPGKYAIQSYGDKIEFKSCIEYVELAYPLQNKTDNAASVEFGNYYGDKEGDVKFALNNGWFEIRSESLKDYDMVLYAAKPSELFDNQILFSVEESYWGEAPSVKWKDNKYVTAPEIGNHMEITYVFKNQPKVEEIKKVTLSKNMGGIIKIPAFQLGIDENTKSFWLEAELKKHTGLNMPYTLFRSTLPEQTAHMFCEFLVADRM